MGLTSFGGSRMRIAVGAFALLVLAVPAQSQPDQANAFAPECAARDLEVVILIEQQGQGEEVASERVAHEAMTMMLAREVCAAGRVNEAIAIYDSIIGALLPMFPMLSQRGQ
jgi:hypothetical protein